MLIENPAGGYAFIPSLRFASGGVVSLPGKSIVRAAFADPLPLTLGFEAVRRHLDHVGRPLASLCGFELRMRDVLDWAGFDRFNMAYVAQLESWNLLQQGSPPLVRTNVVPASHFASENAIVAFSYTEEAADGVQDFITSGVPEMIAGAEYPDNILLRGETSEGALINKTCCVVESVRRLTDELGVVWDNSCTVRLYSRWPLTQQLRRNVLADAGISPVQGIIWLDADPPVFELELEIDVRRHHKELTLSADTDKQRKRS